MKRVRTSERPSAPHYPARERAPRGEREPDPFDDFMADIDDGERARPPAGEPLAEAAPPQMAPDAAQRAAAEPMRWARRGRFAALPPVLFLLLAALTGAGWRVHVLGDQRDLLARQLSEAGQAQRQARLSALKAEAELVEAQRALSDTRKVGHEKVPANLSLAAETSPSPKPAATDCATPRSILRGRGL